MGVPGFQEEQAPEAEGELLMLSVNAMEEAYESSGSRLTADLVRRISTKVGQAFLRLSTGSAFMGYLHKGTLYSHLALGSPSPFHVGDSVERLVELGLAELGRMPRTALIVACNQVRNQAHAWTIVCRFAALGTHMSSGLQPM